MTSTPMLIKRLRKQEAAWAELAMEDEFAGMKTEEKNGEGCNFDNLSTLVAVCHCLLPLLAIPLTFLLIPNKLMTDKIVEVSSE